MNGKTKTLTFNQLVKISSEYKRTRVKKDLEAKYSVSIMTLRNVIANQSCSQRIYDKIFKKLFEHWVY